MSSTARRDAPPALASSRFLRLQGLLGLTQSELAAMLEVSPKTLGRRPLEPAETERFRIIEQLTQTAMRLVPRAHLPRWFAEPKVYLDNVAPKTLLGSERGRRALEAYLMSLVDSAVL